MLAYQIVADGKRATPRPLRTQSLKPVVVRTGRWSSHWVCSALVLPWCFPDPANKKAARRRPLRNLIFAVT